MEIVRKELVIVNNRWNIIILSDVIRVDHRASALMVIVMAHVLNAKPVEDEDIVCHDKIIIARLQDIGRIVRMLIQCLAALHALLAISLILNMVTVKTILLPTVDHVVLFMVIYV